MAEIRQSDMRMRNEVRPAPAVVPRLTPAEEDAIIRRVVREELDRAVARIEAEFEAVDDDAEAA